MVYSQPAPKSHIFEFNHLPAIPAQLPDSVQAGLAGAFCGISGDVLILAGGANFPGNQSWSGAKKQWQDQVYILKKQPDDRYEWIANADLKLHQKRAYGLSISTDKGLICIGGENGSESSDEVLRLNWNDTKQQLTSEFLPPLPQPLAYMCGARVKDQIFVAGGGSSQIASKVFYRLDLTQEGRENFGWKELESWPGPPRILATAVSQSDGTHHAFYLFGGRNVQADQTTEILSDAYKYDLQKNQWIRQADISIDGKTYPLMAGTSSAAGAHHILFWGGATGEKYLEAEALAKKLAANFLPDSIRTHLKSEQRVWLQKHPGFSKNILAFNTITQAWHISGTLPESSPVTTQALNWGDRIVIPSGEIKPGVRTSGILEITPSSQSSKFGFWNYVSLFGYLLFILITGLYFSRRQKSSGDYFKGGGRIPWWAAGISIFGTMLSAITFMAIPAKTFATDWSYFMMNMGIILVAPLIAIVFIPFYSRLSLTSAYEYLEMRFNLLTRLLGSAAFVIFQLGRMAIVLFLPALAISLVSGLNVYTAILCMGLISIIYTVSGGIEAVIWTDVIQVLILFVGALLSLFLMINHLDAGLSEWYQIASNDHKLNLFDFRFDWTFPGFWVVLIGGIGASIITQGTDQSIVQRYQTVQNLHASRKTLYTNAVLTLPATLLFFALGTSLYVFYKSQPQLADPMLANNDAIYPLYIVRQLPAGIAGFLIAAIFSAAMSSLSSSINSGATAFCKDFYQRFSPSLTDQSMLKVAKISSLIFGILGVLLALWMAGSDIKSFWDEFTRILGLFTGGLGGVFLLGMLSTRANGKGAVIGILASGMIQWWISMETDLHFILFSATGILSCLVIGYLASLVLPSAPKSLENLTIHS